MYRQNTSSCNVLSMTDRELWPWPSNWSKTGSRYWNARYLGQSWFSSKQVYTVTGKYKHRTEQILL